MSAIFGNPMDVMSQGLDAAKQAGQQVLSGNMKPLMGDTMGNMVNGLIDQIKPKSSTTDPYQPPVPNAYDADGNLLPTQKDKAMGLLGDMGMSPERMKMQNDNITAQSMNLMQMPLPSAQAPVIRTAANPADKTKTLRQQAFGAYL